MASASLVSICAMHIDVGGGGVRVGETSNTIVVRYRGFVESKTLPTPCISVSCPYPSTPTERAIHRMPPLANNADESCVQLEKQCAAAVAAQLKLRFPGLEGKLVAGVAEAIIQESSSHHQL